MKFWSLLFTLFFALPGSAKEHLILCGGPALRKWEDLRVARDRHDRWWANFIRASTMRMDEIRKAHGSNTKITWMVYQKGYQLRAQEDGKPYTTWVQEQATKRKAQLIWINTGSEAIRAINSRPNGSIVSFDYFGHSNKYCFLLDYGSEVMAVATTWIHQKDLGKLRRGAFSRNAHCQSWGCHTGESMSKVWQSRLGLTLIGARGKTDYSALSFGKFPTVNGSWIR
ncbi:MAG: hypothetical protein ACON5H_00665 [Akkermansiaceae bacterium]